MEVDINGIKLKKDDLLDYRIRTPIFDVSIPKNNILGAEPGISKVASDGYWVSLAALPSGKHKLYFAAEVSTVNGSLIEDIHANTKERSVKIGRTMEENIGFVNNTAGFQLHLSKMETGKKYLFNFEGSSYEVTKNETGEVKLSELTFRTEVTYNLLVE